MADDTDSQEEFLIVSTIATRLKKRSASFVISNVILRFVNETYHHSAHETHTRLRSRLRNAWREMLLSLKFK